MPLITDKDPARKLARAIASDICLYHEEALQKAAKDHDNLNAEGKPDEDKFWASVNAELKQELDEGRGLFKSRVNKEIYADGKFFDDCAKELLFSAKGNIIKKG